MCRILFSIVIAGCIMTGCSRGIPGTTISLERRVVDSLDLSHVLSITQIVPLDNQVPEGNIIRVSRNNAGIYVWASNRINRYTIDGKYLGQVGKSGRGPGEYVSISNFSLSDNEVLIIDGYTRLLIYDLEGNFLRATSIPFYAAAGKVFDNLIFLDSGCQNGQEKKFHVYSLDTLEELFAFQEIDDAERTYRHFMRAEHYYVSEDNKLLYHESLNNRVYQLYPDRVEILYSFDFWGNNPPDSFFSQRYRNVAEIFGELSSNGYVCGITAYASGNGKHLLMFSAAGKTGLAFSDLANKETCQSERIYFQGTTRSMTDEEIAMSFNSAKDVSFAVPASALLETTLSEDDNPVLIFAEFR